MREAAALRLFSNRRLKVYSEITRHFGRSGVRLASRISVGILIYFQSVVMRQCVIVGLRKCRVIIAQAQSVEKPVSNWPLNVRCCPLLRRRP